MWLSYLWAKAFKKAHLSAIKNSNVDCTAKIEAGSHVVESSFGRHSFCGYNCEIINAEIGSFCSIANSVSIGGSQHPIKWVSTSPVFREGRDSVTKKYARHEFRSGQRTVIGHDVWIGERALIKQGVVIGTGSVIGMGSVVTRDVAPYSIVGGVPARIIRKRFGDDIVESLLRTRWWDFDDEKLSRLAVFVTDPLEFIREANRK